MCALLDVAAGDVRVAGEVVDVQLDRGGAGVLHRARVVASSPPGVTPLRLRDHRDVDGGGGALEQAQVAVRSGVLLGAGREVGERLGEALGGLVDEPRDPRGLLAAAAPRTARTARPRRRRRPPAAGRRRACRTAARPRPRAGCAAQGPGSWSRAPSAVLAGVGREAARRRGWPSPRTSASAGRPPAGRAPSRRSASAGSALASVRKRSSRLR